MQYRIRNGDQLIATVNSKNYRVTGLTPNTSYTFSIVAFNGLRESTKATRIVNTRGIRVTIPTSLTVGTTLTLIYQEYSLGSVPLGSEPTGLGGSTPVAVPAKVISSSNGQSMIEITNSFNLMADGHIMQHQIDGTYVASEGYKSLYYQGR